MGLFIWTIWRSGRIIKTSFTAPVTSANARASMDPSMRSSRNGGNPMMFNDTDFVPVTLDDAQLICATICAKPITKKAITTSSTCFNGWIIIRLWKLVMPDYILLLGVHKGKLFMYMPLGEARYFEAAIRHARAIFQRYGIPFELSCFTEARKGSCFGDVSHPGSHHGT
jgi:hypothetical protein